MRIYNSLTRTLEEFEPINPPHVGLYTCGPTVYQYATVGNFRTYVTSDLLLRSLKFEGYEVDFIMNLTDVGHLTGDNEGDADQGEDRLEKSAKKEGKSAWNIAEFYTKAFFEDFAELNITKPRMFAKATDHIGEQIALIQKLEQRGLTYKITDGIYFDTEKYEALTHKKYGELSDLDQIKEGARVEPNPEKKNPRDFALWKFSPSGEKRQMEWESPWGIGFPGWHVECSAMSMKYLGETFDIHTGGEDLRSTHHPNEIAQSEGATGKLFVKYWLHSSFLRVDGKRMGKSLGNAFTVSDVVKKGFDPLALRYFYLTGHYRSPLNFTWEGLHAAQNALERLRNSVRALKDQEEERTVLSREKLAKIKNYRSTFLEAISDDLNFPQALAVVWEVVKSSVPSIDKQDLLLSFDEVLGLHMDKKLHETQQEMPAEIKKLMEERERLRLEKNFEAADRLRQQIEEKGYTVSDAPLKS